MNDLVSVIIPVYNSEKTLRKCIGSVQEQTYRNLEIILIDDGSADKSAEICDALAKEDDRITVIHIPNGGAGNARNVGIELSHGKYLAFADSDDYADKDMIEELFCAAEANKSDCAVSAVSSETLSESAEVSFSDETNGEILYSLFEKNILYAPWAKLYRSSVIRNNHVDFPTDLNYGEDMVFNVRHMRHIDTISYVNKNYYHYIRDNQESLSQKVRWNMFDNDMVFEEQLRDLFIEKNIFTDRIKEYDAYRIMGVAYDSLFLLTRKDCPFKSIEIKQYISNVIQNDLVQWSLALVNTDRYASWMINPMKRKQAWKIRMLCYIKRKL